MQFYALTVRDIHRETPECVSISFDVPADLKPVFQFKAGQYLNLRTHINGEEVRRSYSICTAPHEDDLRVAVKKVAGGVFSTFANTELQVGDTLDCAAPEGRFNCVPDAGNARWIVAFAAGSGITPIMSMLKTLLEQEPNSQIMLIYGNRNFDQIIFREQLEHLKNKYPDRLAVHHVFSRESMPNDLYQGHIDADKCGRFAKYFFDPKVVDQFYLCGPAEMIFSLKETLLGLGVAEDRVKFELFTTGQIAKRAPRADGDRPALESRITVVQDGIEYDFQLPADGSPLLDAAMRAGADLPFSCKGGVCSTCKAKVLEGEVEMDINYGLEPDEVAAGYILTCQAHPKTDRVVVTFDV